MNLPNKKKGNHAKSVAPVNRDDNHVNTTANYGQLPP